MPDDQQRVKLGHHIRLEKRNEVGELYETVEVTADGDGRVTSAKVVQRKKGLAPAEAYAQLPIEGKP